MKRLIAALILAPILAFAQVTTNPTVTGVGVNLSTGKISGTLGVANGGTGATTAQAAAAAIAAPRILAKSAIPFIGLGSCTMSAGGALSACTALPVAYANAYCYLPANAAATSIAAGWYYCTFSTTQAGTVYLNTYTSGVPTIPTSPTAVTTGSSFTGDTGEEFGPTITVPANALGANGSLRFSGISWNTNVTTNNKTIRVRYSGNAGTAYTTNNLNSTAGSSNSFATGYISNRGVTGSQAGNMTLYNTGNTIANNFGTVYSAVDTTAQSSIVLSCQRATATDNCVLETFMIELLSDGT